MTGDARDASIRSVRSRLRDARSVAILTGAGISAESGLRTFRGASVKDIPAELQTTMKALWQEFDPAKLATPEAFGSDPAMVTRWYDWRRLGCLAAEPNHGHRALVELERAVTSRAGTFTILTQNVDRLHQRAGSVSVVELHGSIIEWRCTSTGRRFTPAPTAMTEFPPRSPFDPSGMLRPDVVWFGEMLPVSAVDAARRAAEVCDIFFSIGTSAVVYPAAGFIELAAANGAFTVEVNQESTPISRRVDVTLRGSAGDLLRRIVDGL